MSEVFSFQDFVDAAKPVTTQWEIVDDIVQQVTGDCLHELDGYIDSVKKLFSDDSTNLSNEDLETIIFKIPLLLYWLTDPMEVIGVKEDISNMMHQEKYRQAFTELNGSIANKKIQAEADSYEEELVNLIYSKSYKLVKSKVDMAFEIMQSAKKIMNKRVVELEIDRRSN